MKNQTTIARRPGRKGLVAVALLAALCLPPAGAAVYTEGHADYGLAYSGGALDFHFHAEGATVDGIERDDEEFALEDVVTRVTQDAMLTLPVDFPALGADSGASVWVLPEVNDPALPFAGLATEELSAAEWGDLSFALGTVASPSGSGHFALWQSGSFGELLLRMSTADPGPDTLDLLPGSHAHYNWGFTEAGIWEIEFIVSGTHVTDGFKSTSGTLVFEVVPEPSSLLLCGLGGMLAFTRRRR